MCCRTNPQIGGAVPIAAVVARAETRTAKIGYLILLITVTQCPFGQRLVAAKHRLLAGHRHTALSNLLFKHRAVFHREGIGRQMGDGQKGCLRQIVPPLGKALLRQTIDKVNADVVEPCGMGIHHRLHSLACTVPAVEQMQVAVAKRLHPDAYAVEKTQCTKCLEIPGSKVFGIGLKCGLLHHRKVIIVMKCRHYTAQLCRAEQSGRSAAEINGAHRMFRLVATDGQFPAQRIDIRLLAACGHHRIESAIGAFAVTVGNVQVYHAIWHFRAAYRLPRRHLFCSPVSPGSPPLCAAPCRVNYRNGRANRFLSSR